MATGGIELMVFLAVGSMSCEGQPAATQRSKGADPHCSAGVPTRCESEFVSDPDSTTTIQRPTVLSWAFSLLVPAEHAGFARILRVPGGGQNQRPWSLVRPFSALCSLEISANFFAVAHAHRLA